MAYQFSLDDVRYLTSAAGIDALAAAASLPITNTTLLTDLTMVRKFASQHAAAVVETVRLRRRAVSKLGERAVGWLFTDESLQQASPWPVAEHRAARMVAADNGVHDVTCSIGTDLAALSATGCRPLLGSDLDPVRLAMAAINVPGIPIVRADALAPTSAGLTPYADPARRTASGRRITSIDTVPSVAALDAAYPDRPPVLRLPPGIDYDELRRPGEVEIVSLDGTAREAVLWPRAFAQGAVRRRASVLGSDGSSWQLTDVDDDGAADTLGAPAGQWIVDPDAAVVRAHLVRHYAAAHGLQLLDQHLAYLSGNSRPAGARAFEVLDMAPFSERTIAGWLSRDGVGTLEIKQRGTPVVPDELRRRLHPSMTGDTRTAATLIVARIGDATMAFWCRAHEPGLPG